VPITDPPDTTPPHVALMEPFNGAQAQYGQVRLFYFVDDYGLSGMKTADVIIDGSVRVAGTTNNPVVLNLSSGAHTWQVRGYDNAGNSALSEIRALTVVGGTESAPALALKDSSMILPNTFSFRFDSVAGKNYTVQFSSNSLTWPTLLVTNAASSSVNVMDRVSSGTRVYRVLSDP
jgi:hypothetical protein